MTAALDQLERAVLEVLAGTPVAQAAGRYDLDPDHLEACVEAYRSAGQEALSTLISPRWQHWRINTPDAGTQERLLRDQLGPLLADLVATGAIQSWWFLRKWDGEYHLRLRVYGTEPALRTRAVPAVRERLHTLVQQGLITGWAEAIYEPETAVFGGEEGMNLAHAIFHQDSDFIVRWLAAEGTAGGHTPPTTSDGGATPRLFASLVVMQHLIRGAGLDIFEQSDVWGKVMALRPWKEEALVAAYQKNAAQVIGWLRATEPQMQSALGPALYPVVRDWAAALHRLGEELARANREGRLQRGLRQVLAHHVIFHWGRMGFTYPMQVGLAYMVHRALAERCQL